MSKTAKQVVGLTDKFLDDVAAHEERAGWSQEQQDIAKVVEALMPRNPGADAFADYMRIRMREDGFMRQILPPRMVTAEDLK